MTNVTVSKAYRGLLRELIKSSRSPRSSRNNAITVNLREALLGRSAKERDLAQTLRYIDNTTSFLRASRIHAELLERYSPLHDLTEEQRIHATARRVGLDTPEEYKP